MTETKAEEILAATLVREELLLSKQAQLEAENAKLRAGIRSAAAVIDAYIQDFADIQTADGIDAADTYTALRALLEGGE